MRQHNRLVNRDYFNDKSDRGGPFQHHSEKSCTDDVQREEREYWARKKVIEMIVKYFKKEDF